MYLFTVCRLLSVLAVIGSSVASSDVIGCGGFIKSIVAINFNKILIKLLTDKGIVKYSTDCAPNNGYYFIPLYDRGQYQIAIEPPHGWTFDPMTVDLDFDGKTDLCSQQQDINFSFKGFTISGKVFSEGSDSGPSGVSVTLKAKNNNNVLKTTLTSEEGFYQFKEVLPGEYIIEGSHPTWKFKKSKVQINVAEDNIDVTAKTDNSLSILGYEVTGNVMSDNEPIQSVLFGLFSPIHQPVVDCDKKQIPIKSPNSDLIYLCHVESDESGSFRFPTVPIGSYMLIPFYGGNKTKFDVKPNQLAFEVSNEDISIDTVFQIEGFSVWGRVLVGQSGVDNAEVQFLDQSSGRQITTTTQTNGVYTLDNIKTGNYMISVTAKHMSFEPIVAKISPVTAQIPDISPNAFEVCGSFVLKSANTAQTTIEFKSTKFTETIVSDMTERFCVPLKPETYSISLVTSDENVKLIPSKSKITVKSEPVLDLKFSQFTATLTGRIITKDSTDDLHIQLLNQMDGKTVRSLKFSDLKRVSPNRFDFSVENVLPGTYRLSISKDSDSWCWLKDSVVVQIIDKDINDIEFSQMGYILSLYFSHKIDFELKSPSDKVENLSVGSDHTLRHCVTESGVYSIVPKGCHKFSESPNEVVAFDTSKDVGKLISRTAVKHLVSANILTYVNVSDIVLNVKTKSSGGEEYSQKLHLEQSRTVKRDNQLLYEYLIAIWAKPLQNIFLEPSSGQLLFKPNSFETNTENDCLENMITFVGKIGLFINGQISPKLDNVVIKIKSSDDLLLTTKTDSLGKYVAGPFDCDIKLSVSAEKDGYSFRPVPNKLGHFEATRLSRISVQVKDDNGQPLPDVLISISGGADNYRKNSVTPTSGRLTFDNLHLGQYFIRLMLKEYDFEPSSKMVSVTDGSDLTVDVVGKKVAFSAVGVTDSLNGEPEPGVVVEAVGLRNVVSDAKVNCDHLQEEAVSEANGGFRLRGLRPECQYALRLKANDERNKHFNQTIPRIHLIRVEDNDVTDIRLIVFRKVTQMDVSGDVITSSEFLSTLKVRLFSETNGDQPITTIAMSSSPFFFLPVLTIDNKNYIIRIESSLSPNLYEFESLSKTFRANTSHLHLSFSFSPKPKANANSYHYTDHDVNEGSVFLLPFIVLVTLAVFNYKKIQPFIVQISDFINRFNNERIGQRDRAREDSPSVGPKRKTKSKKI